MLPLLLGVLLTGCYNDNEESLYANYNNLSSTASCDTVNLTYTSQIKAILDANCISCHNTGSGHAAILDTPADVMSAASGWNLYDFSGNSNHTGNVNLDNCSKKQLRIWSANPVQ
ncbi:MAG: hypothetical protein WCM76_16180 [Bacteroidota bacterium]